MLEVRGRREKENNWGKDHFMGVLQFYKYVVSTVSRHTNKPVFSFLVKSNLVKLEIISTDASPCNESSPISVTKF